MTRCPQAAGRCENPAGHDGDHYTEYREPVWTHRVGAVQDDGLDVERLARAIHSLYPTLRKTPTGVECDHFPVYGDDRTECRFDADEIAAAYLRAASPLNEMER